MCERHYYRKRRTGSYDLKPRNAGWKKGGYLVQTALGHPMSNAQGHAYVHRIVAFEKYGPGPQSCHWCSKGLPTWSCVKVDHLDEDKANNDPDNLVTACNDCNRARGAVIPLLQRVTSDRLEELLETFRAMHAARLSLPPPAPAPGA